MGGDGEGGSGTRGEGDVGCGGKGGAGDSSLGGMGGEEDDVRQGQVTLIEDVMSLKAWYG